jgi:fructose-1,6-bisphosphatase
MIKAPHLKLSEKFTIVNLREAHIQNYSDEIQKIINQAELEMKFEIMLAKIESEWTDLNLTLVPYKLSEDTYILVETDAITGIIEEHMTTLESLSVSANAAHVLDSIKKWQDLLIMMRGSLERWV